MEQGSLVSLLDSKECLIYIKKLFCDGAGGDIREGIFPPPVFDGRGETRKNNVDCMIKRIVNER
jgi:hypothetical protein